MSYSSHSVRTASRTQFVEITGEVKKAVASAGVDEGICIVFVPHTTAAVTINEHADPSVVHDLGSQLDELVPANHGYTHREGNADSHIKTVVTGPSVTLIVHRGELVLGTWQGIFFCEYDGPRNRSFHVKVMVDRS